MYRKLETLKQIGKWKRLIMYRERWDLRGRWYRLKKYNTLILRRAPTWKKISTDEETVERIYEKEGELTGGWEIWKKIEFVKLGWKGMLLTAAETVTQNPDAEHDWKGRRQEMEKMLSRWRKAVPETVRLQQNYQINEKRKMWTRVRHEWLLCCE